jgi:hypothetical protein
MLPFSFNPFAILVVFLIGISKSGFGGGLGVLGVPLMLLVIAPPKAAAILLPLLISIDFLTVYHYRRQYHKRNLRILLPEALLGIILGSLFFRYQSDAHIRLLIGGLSLTFVGNHLLQNQVGTNRNTSVPMMFFGEPLTVSPVSVYMPGAPDQYLSVTATA